MEDYADRLREECGVFGIFGHPDAAAVTALGLHALQHRGQEATGIVTFDGTRFHSERRLGLVGDAFSVADLIMAAVLIFGRRAELTDGLPTIAAYLERIESRPARQRAVAVGNS